MNPIFGIDDFPVWARFLAVLVSQFFIFSELFSGKKFKIKAVNKTKQNVAK